MFKEKRIERRKDNIIINMGNQPKPRILESKIIRLLYIFFHAVVLLTLRLKSMQWYFLLCGWKVHCKQCLGMV